MTFDTLVSREQLASKLHAADWRVFDCRFDLADTQRGATAYAQAHLPGACYAHLEHDLSSPITPHSGRHPLPDPAQLAEWLGSHGIGKTTQVVAYDDTGGSMAVRLWWLLRWLGHDRVALLNGGWKAWVDLDLPLETSRPATPPPVSFVGAPNPDMLVTTAAIERQLQAGSDAYLVMDARTAERFRGEAEPIDPVAGHIPGAVNLPLQHNLAGDGRFRSAAELRAIYGTVLAGRPADQVVAMCGSGVTACHNLLAMEVAGLHGGRLYAGSWSEWIRDPAHPVAVGD